MIHPKIDDLTSVVPSKYALVMVASRRARELNDYHRQLGDVEFIAERQYCPPMVESRSKNYLTMALEEVAADKVAWETPES
jgi:DNA-directed RNA polymerase subunit omega